jgi:anaerobic ribonucleoside-triphosphate reductase activating protein
MPGDSTTLRIYHTEPSSRSNGPGWRAVIWLQGCTLGCPGCFNPETHPLQTGRIARIDELADWVLALSGKIEGLTISGGEPIQQITGLLPFLERIRRASNLSMILFSGYTWAEIQKMPRSRQLLSSIDVLLAGRYNPNLRLARGLVGSKNKSVHFLTERYSQADLDAVPEAEVIVTDHGEIIFSGINPLKW